jgi:hypothetical protein
MCTRPRWLPRSWMEGSGELRTQRLAGSAERVVEFCAGLPAPVRLTFEAGPTGFGPARRLKAAGVERLVAAPGETARPAGGAGQDRPPRRGVVGAADDGGAAARGAGADARGRVAARPGAGARGSARRSDASPASGRKVAVAPRAAFHEGAQLDAGAPGVARAVELDEPVAQAVLVDGVGAIDALVVRRDALERQMETLWRSCRCAAALSVSQPTRWRRAEMQPCGTG